VSNLSVIFHKTERTIRNWIKDWEENRNVDRHQGIVNPRKYDAGKQRFSSSLSRLLVFGRVASRTQLSAC